MPRFDPYEPPPLSERVTLRLASGEPTLNDFGQVTAAAVSTEARVWAHRYDRRSSQDSIAGAVIQQRYTTFTIRFRSDVDEETVVLHRGERYIPLGPPLVRGRGTPGHLELDCVFAT